MVGVDVHSESKPDNNAVLKLLSKIKETDYRYSSPDQMVVANETPFDSNHQISRDVRNIDANV